jgi:hypothetical protein
MQPPSRLVKQASFFYPSVDWGQRLPGRVAPKADISCDFITSHTDAAVTRH